MIFERYWRHEVRDVIIRIFPDFLIFSNYLLCSEVQETCDFPIFSSSVSWFFLESNHSAVLWSQE